MGVIVHAHESPRVSVQFGHNDPRGRQPAAIRRLLERAQLYVQTVRCDVRSQGFWNSSKYDGQISR